MVSLQTPIGREVAAGRVRPGGAQGDLNVGSVERMLSLAGGGLLAFLGLRQRTPAGLGLAALGGGLLYRGATGHCPMYATLGVNTSETHGPAASMAAGAGFKVVRAVTINRPAAELYAMWRNLEALPHFMSHLVSVKEDGKRSHWVARGPAGRTVEWDAEIITEEPNRLIGWRSLEGSDVSTAGSVHFDPAPGGRGTEVRVTLKYDPPAGQLGSWLAWLFGREPGQQVREDLRRFKQLAEAGEVPSTQGQPRCHG
jgi:uncharacterized membrane protein